MRVASPITFLQKPIEIPRRFAKHFFRYMISILAVLLVIKLVTEILIIGSEVFKPISRDTILPNTIGRNTSVKILLYTNLVRRLPVRDTRYEIHQHLFVNNDVTNFKMVSKEVKQLRFQAHKDYLSRLIIGFDVVVFHVKDMPGWRLLKDISRHHRPSEQYWAYYNKESPYNTINIRGGKYDGIFNITITPLRDSDVFSPYGFYRKKRNKAEAWRLKRYFKTIFTDSIIGKNRKNTSGVSLLKEQTLINTELDFNEKDLLIAWVVSNCNQARDVYASSLLRHIPIHVYGKCARKFKQFDTICHRNNYDCEVLLRRYKFVLAFENSFCDDYVTDKYWNALFRGNVPIVLGGNRYDTIIPGSFINTRDFSSARSLAEHIRNLSQNKSAYEGYMRWKEHYVLDYIPNDQLRYDKAMDKLYEIVKKPMFERKSYNLSEFYGVRKNCPLQYVTNKQW